MLLSDAPRAPTMSTESLIRQLEEQRAAFLALEQRVHDALRQQEAAAAEASRDESPSSPTFSDGIGRQSTVSFADPGRKSTGLASILHTSSAISVDSDDEDDETFYVGSLPIGPSSDHLELLRPLGIVMLRFSSHTNPLDQGSNASAVHVVSRRRPAHPLEDLRLGVVRPDYPRRSSAGWPIAVSLSVSDSQ